MTEQEILNESSNKFPFHQFGVLTMVTEKAAMDAMKVNAEPYILFIRDCIKSYHVWRGRPVDWFNIERALDLIEMASNSQQSKQQNP